MDEGVADAETALVLRVHLEVDGLDLAGLQHFQRNLRLPPTAQQHKTGLKSLKLHGPRRAAFPVQGAGAGAHVDGAGAGAQVDGAGAQGEGAGAGAQGEGAGAGAQREGAGAGAHVDGAGGAGAGGLGAGAPHHWHVAAGTQRQ